MRVSTATAFYAPVEAMIRQQAEIERTQQEISSGQKVRELAENPSQAAHVSELDRFVAASQRYAINSEVAANRLKAGEATINSALDLVQRARELAVASANDGLDVAARKAIAAEVRGINDQLLSLANRRGENGEYMFAGSLSGAAPFSRQGTGVVYVGNTQEREIPISATRTVADGFSGDDVFMDVTAANGAFRTAPVATNTGVAVIDVGSVIDGEAWGDALADSPSGYSIVLSVSGSTTTYTVRDANGDDIDSGIYSSGRTLTFLGIQVSLQGQPADGDKFLITRAPAGGESLFETLDRLVAALETPTLNSATRAQVGTVLGGVIHQLDNGINNLSDVRSSVAARLQTIDENTAFREEQEIAVKETLSELRDVDFAEALARLNAQMTALQVAQQAYARISNRSLFDYL